MERNLRSNTEIYLIGFEKSQILGSKLPTIKEVLQLFFYHVRTQNTSIRQSASLATREAILFWEKAKIPTRKEQHCIDKLLKLYEEWRIVQKSSKSRNKTEVHRKNESDFETKLNHIFDIAHSNANKKISKEGQIFLENQRSEKRVGSLAGIDKKAMQKEQRKNDRIDAKREKKRRYEESKMLSQQGCVYKICLSQFHLEYC